MCFSSSMPKLQKPAAAPTSRDAALEGVQDRQRAAAAAQSSGSQSTIATSPMGAGGQAPVYKQTLGG
jgi:hypothetical protein